MTLPCSGTMGFLTGNCGVAENVGNFFFFGSRCITVGDTYGASNWYKSPVNGLVPSQYDDRYCFEFNGLKFDYQNQGFTRQSLYRLCR